MAVKGQFGTRTLSRAITSKNVLTYLHQTIYRKLCASLGLCCHILLKVLFTPVKGVAISWKRYKIRDIVLL